jgi:hypothetical protein
LRIALLVFRDRRRELHRRGSAEPPSRPLRLGWETHGRRERGSAGLRSLVLSESILSRAEGDKCVVPESHGDGKKARISVGSDQKATRMEYRYRFQHLRRTTFRQIYACRGTVCNDGFIQLSVKISLPVSASQTDNISANSIEQTDGGTVEPVVAADRPAVSDRTRRLTISGSQWSLLPDCR